jgi:hypothetical protein
VKSVRETPALASHRTPKFESVLDLTVATVKPHQRIRDLMDRSGMQPESFAVAEAPSGPGKSELLVLLWLPWGFPDSQTTAKSFHHFTHHRATILPASGRWFFKNAGCAVFRKMVKRTCRRCAAVLWSERGGERSGSGNR